MIAKSPDRSKQKKLLIIEDDISISRPISLLLTHYEFEVTIAMTLAQGVIAIRNNPDLIILDLELPDGNGLEVLRKIRGAGNSAKVFILTGDSRPEVERICRRLMPDGFFKKPFNFIEILDAVRNATTDQSGRDILAA